MDDLDKYLEKSLKNPEFKKEWDKLEMRYEVIKLLLDIREKYGLSQKELAQKVGTTQAVISRIENGSVNVSLNFLQQLVKPFHKKIELKLVDNNSSKKSAA